MNSDCLWFCRSLRAFADGRLASDQNRRAEDHLVHCEACLEKWTQSLGVLPDLTEAILAETHMDPCSRAERLLSQARDLPLPSEEEALLSVHLQHCVGCGQLEAVLGSLSPELRDMAFLEPDPYFTRDVLRRIGAISTTLGWRARFHGFWVQLVRRPRFAMEAAYVLTLFLALVLQIQTPSAKAVSELRSGSETLAEELSQVTRRMDQRLGSTGERLMGNLSVYLRQTNVGPQQLLTQTTLMGQTIFAGFPLYLASGDWPLFHKTNEPSFLGKWFSRERSAAENNIGENNE